MNEVIMSGIVRDLQTLRFTPAGIPVAEFRLRHSSLQREAGHERRVALDLPAVAFGRLAQQLADAAPAGEVTARGFLAQRSQRSAEIVLHANTIAYE